MTEKNSKAVENNLTWHHANVTLADRIKLFHQTPATVWLTGLSGAGKSTLAYALEKHLLELGQASYVLDGDNVRHGLNSNLGFSHEDRTENIRRIAEVARLMNDAGLIVITAFISPYREDREVARRIIGGEKFIEVHVSTPLTVCEGRDPKGIYKRARSGEIQDFTGISSPYEPPFAPVISLDTTSTSIASCTAEILAILRSRLTLANIPLKQLA
jgi:adenylylsulfate kinase